MLIYIFQISSKAEIRCSSSNSKVPDAVPSTTKLQEIFLELLTPEVISPLNDDAEPPSSKKSRKTEKSTAKKVRPKTKSASKASAAPSTSAADETTVTRKKSTRKSKASTAAAAIQPQIKTEAVDEETPTSSRRKSRRKTASATNENNNIEPSKLTEQVVHLNEFYAGKQAPTDDGSLRCQQLLKPVLSEMLSIQMKCRNTLDLKADKVSKQLRFRDKKTD